MAFTTREIVKKHILEHRLGSGHVENELVQLTGDGWIELQRRMILEDSERVKGKEQLEPTQEIIDFAGSDNFELSHTELTPETVVLAADSSLGTIYIENVDYNIDYDTGTVRRIDSGSIAQGSSAVIWYLYYRLYQRGADYEINYQKGQIRRKSSGAIEPGQRVLVDYTAEFGGLDDDAIDNAITEANEHVIAYIDASYKDSSDRSLVTAETYLAVSIICRIRAMEAITASATGRSATAEGQSWAALSDMYRKDAYLILYRFAGAIGSLKSPSKA
jgi:hypothetical protein